MNTAARFCKSKGLDGLLEVEKASKQSPQTLRNWFKNKPELFALVVDGCVWRRELEKRK